jgi:hypothetical protein
MARTVVYDTPAVLEKYVEATGGTRRSHRTATKDRQAAERAAGQASAAPAATPARSDDYVSKIAKYVPAETIAISTLFFGTWAVSGNWIWFWIGVGAVVNVLYLFVTALQQSGKVPPPRMYFYLLSAAAFVGWAIATVTVARGAAHLVDDKKAGFVLAATAFIIPLLDSGFSYFTVNRPTEQPAAAPGA